jgi:hypothetical protein
VQEVIERLRSLGVSNVEEMPGEDEGVEFRLPEELQR